MLKLEFARYYQNCAAWANKKVETSNNLDDWEVYSWVRRNASNDARVALGIKDCDQYYS